MSLTITQKSKIFRKKQLKSKNIGEIKFRDILNKLQIKHRGQFLISPYIIDIYIPSKGLIIEIDGSIHNKVYVQQRDYVRENYLFSLGLIIIRYNIELNQENPEIFIKNKIIMYPNLDKKKKRKIERKIEFLNNILNIKNFVPKYRKTFQAIKQQYLTWKKNNELNKKLEKYYLYKNLTKNVA